MEKHIDVLGIGLAFTDLYKHVSFDIIHFFGLNSGHVHCLHSFSTEKQIQFKEAMRDCEFSSGGAISNSLASVAYLGGVSKFIGTISDDLIGHFFKDEQHKYNINFQPNILPNQASASCYILITPDGERTMVSDLGVSTVFHSANFPLSLFKQTSVLFFEGEILPFFDNTTLQTLIQNTSHLKIVYTLHSHRDITQRDVDFMNLCDVIIGNENEVNYLNSLPLPGIKKLQSDKIFITTQGSKGILLSDHGQTELIPVPDKIDTPVSTLGAGDAFAGGFIYGYSQNMKLRESIYKGFEMAHQILQQPHAKPN